jgi:ATP-dependent protease ClpP protease subunit
VRLPINGEIGKDVTVASVQAGLDEAAKTSPKYIVLDIDSPGGNIGVMIGILDVLSDAQRDRQVVAYVHNAYSAAAVIAMSCPKIYIAPHGVIGAAVPFLMTNNGPKDVEAKFRSALEAKQRAYISAAGHDPLLLRGMMEMDAEIYLTTADGHPVLHDKGPDGKVIKSKGSILTLTATEASECGLAMVAPDLADAGKQMLGGPWYESSHLPWDAAVAAATSQQRASREQAEVNRQANHTLAAVKRVRPEIAAIATRIHQLGNTISADVHAARDLKSRYQADQKQAETDYQFAIARSQSADETSRANYDRDAKLASLRHDFTGAFEKLKTEADAASSEIQQLHDREKLILASLSND